MLKHIRWIRNNIAHNNGDSECSESDVQYVKNFYQRIINRTDSFSLINAEIRKADIPASVSNSAGTYVCNHLMYGVLYTIAKSRRQSS